MKKEVEFTLVAGGSDDTVLRASALEAAGVAVGNVVINRVSLDGRRRPPVWHVIATVSDEEPEVWQKPARAVRTSHSVIVVGSGPAGYFAALRLLEHGIHPIVLERGSDVRSRRRHLRLVQQDGIVNPDSNYCFGEGGAGTYSDGKLYTRADKRGSVNRILNILVEHGATPSILYEARPHIGSNKLWLVVSAMRQSILAAGGEVHFNTRVTDFMLEDKTMLGVVDANGREWRADAVVLATGHSARDIFYLCQARGIAITAKDFALGVRIEHPQHLIDSMQYGVKHRGCLPSASYRFTCDADGRGAFSFCMCPGGIIVPAATAPGEVVVNGMSMSQRNTPYANSGFVVTVGSADFAMFDSAGALAGMIFQAYIEQRAFSSVGDGSQRAPAQRAVDFMAAKVSSSLPNSSYIPGLASVDLGAILPPPIAASLRTALRKADRKMTGYLSHEAVLVAPESRTSSPVRIERDRNSLQHVDICGLYPCGEGAGYAGGIMSAAIDGEKVADVIARSL